uniref:Uncharacterized protein n=1 Tax=Rhizophora mucronata TaxID=61149 RepID=A0A2P2NHV9_RHIMU
MKFWLRDFSVSLFLFAYNSFESFYAPHFINPLLLVIWHY